MSCCGQKRAAGSASPPQRPSVLISHSAAVPMASSATSRRVLRLVYEYVGPTALSVTSPYTGRRYRFDRSGARLEVDTRDRSLLATLLQLRQVL